MTLDDRVRTAFGIQFWLRIDFFLSALHAKACREYDGCFWSALTLHVSATRSV
jgi:hypothetical protein